MATQTETRPRTRIVWTDQERAAVLREAARLERAGPGRSRLELVERAQQVLPADRRRGGMVVAGVNWAWFLEGLPGALERIGREPEPPPEPTPAPTLLRHSSDTPPALPRHSPGTPPAPAPAPEGILPAGFAATVDGLLLDALALERAERARTSGRLEARLEAVEAALARIAAVLEGGFAWVPLARAAAPVATAPAPAPAVAPPAPPEPSPTRFPAPARPTTRKPRVVVLSVDSGHVKNGIRSGAGDHCGKIDFWDTPRRPADLSNWDFVVCTKWTPLPWVEEARRGPWKDRLRTVAGNGESIAGYLRSLPEVPLANGNP